MSNYQRLWNRVTQSGEDEVIRKQVLQLTHVEIEDLHEAITVMCDVKRDAMCFDPFHKKLYRVGCYLNRVYLTGKIGTITIDEIDSAFDQIHANDAMQAEIMGKYLLVDN